MIQKLYNLKQQELNQEVIKKQALLSKISDIDDELIQTNTKFHTVGLDIMGAISDFRVLEIHKATMKEHMIKLSRNKDHLVKKVEYHDRKIIDFNKESEKFNYILQEQKKEKLKEIMKQEDLVAAEYMQAKFISQKRNLNDI